MSTDSKKPDIVWGKEVLTCLGRAVNLHLKAPETGGKFPDGKYKIELLISKADKPHMRELHNECQTIIATALKTIWSAATKTIVNADGTVAEVPITAKDIVLPFRDGDLTCIKYPHRKGCYYIKPKSKQRPGTVGVDTKNIDPGDIYAGCVCRLEVTPYTYASTSNVQVGNEIKTVAIYGVTLMLRSVQFWKHGPVITFGKAAAPPSEIFKGLPPGETTLPQASAPAAAAATAAPDDGMPF